MKQIVPIRALRAVESASALDLVGFQRGFLCIAHFLTSRAEGDRRLHNPQSQRVISLLWEWRERLGSERERAPVLRRGNPGMKLGLEGEWYQQEVFQ
jgi:hypothetical protein